MLVSVLAAIVRTVTVYQSRDLPSVISPHRGSELALERFPPAR